MTRKDYYIKLITSFLNRSISLQEFETTYFDVFLSEKRLGDTLFLPLDWLFAEVDAYIDDPTAFLEPDHNYINEEQLRESAAKTLAELQAIKK